MSQMLFIMQLSKSCPIISAFSLPSCPSCSGDAEHLLLPADWWHSQMMQESLSRGPAALVFPTTELLSADDCVFGLFTHLLLAAAAFLELLLSVLLFLFLGFKLSTSPGILCIICWRGYLCFSAPRRLKVSTTLIFTSFQIGWLQLTTNSDDNFTM